MSKKNITPEQASKMAVEAARKASESIEAARVAQMKASDDRHLEMLTKALGDIFGNESDNKNPEHMQILIRRIPILCNNIANMHSSIEKIENNIGWVVKIVLGAVVLALLTMVFKQ